MHVSERHLGLDALAGAMAADLAETIVDPAASGDAGTIYDAALTQHAAMVLSAALLLVSSALIVQGVRVVVATFGGKALRLGRTAEVLALLGAIGHGALAGVYLLWASIPGDGASRAQLVQLIDRIDSAPSLALIFPLFVAFPLALLATFGAAAKAGLAPRWVLAAAGAAPVLAVAHPVSDRFATSAALVLLLAAAAGVAIGTRDEAVGAEPILAGP